MWITSFCWLVSQLRDTNNDARIVIPAELSLSLLDYRTLFWGVHTERSGLYFETIRYLTGSLRYYDTRHDDYVNAIITLWINAWINLERVSVGGQGKDLRHCGKIYTYRGIVCSSVIQMKTGFFHMGNLIYEWQQAAVALSREYL